MWYGYYDDAIRQADKSYHLALNQSPAWAWRFQTLEAQALLFAGKSHDAEGLLKGEAPSSIPADVRAQRRLVQAYAFCRAREFAKAEPLLTEAAILIRSDQGSLAAGLALERGRCTPETVPARQHFSLAAALAHGNDEFIEATGLLNVGYSLIKDESYEPGIDKLLEGLQVTGSPLLRGRLSLNLGFAYSELGDWKRAILYTEQAEEFSEEIQDYDVEERSLANLGRAHFALWELPEAEKYYLRALALAKEQKNREGIAYCLEGLTRLALRQGNVDMAEQYLEQGRPLDIESQRLPFTFDAAEIALTRRQFAEAERRFRDLLPASTKAPVLHSMVQRELGRVYWKENKFAPADQMFRDGIESAERLLRGLRRPEFRMSFMDQDPFYDGYIQFLMAQNRPADALGVAERSRAQVLAAASGKDPSTATSVSIPTLQAWTKRHRKTILCYSMTDDATFLWVITPSLFKWFRLPRHWDLGPKIMAFNREIQEHRELADSRAAAELYENLIVEAQQLMPKGSSLIIVPSKLLSMVNFEALIVQKPQPHYWIEDVDVQIAGSLALLSGSEKPTQVASKNVMQLLAFGAPLQASTDFPALKFAPEEMRRVEEHFGSNQRVIFSGKEATPSAYRNSSPGQFRFIHLDTHGLSSDLNPLDSAIILSPGADNSYKLYAQEIKDIPLRADLVTISACSGAGTRWYQGEGLVGLAWAFMHAGAHQVIGALWDVDDASSPQIMDDLYAELTQGKTPAEALRDAKLKMLHSNTFYRHPYYWASLQLYTGS